MKKTNRQSAIHPAHPLLRGLVHAPKTIHVFAFLMLFSGCGRLPIITPSSQAEADKAIDHERARELSDSIASNLVKDDRAAIRNSMEKALRDNCDDSCFSAVIDQMFAVYGKAMQVEYKMDELGRRTGSGGYDKPMRKFWYTTRTSKHEKGTVFLIVEIVPDMGSLATSTVSLVTFQRGVPESLK